MNQNIATENANAKDKKKANLIKLYSTSTKKLIRESQHLIDKSKGPIPFVDADMNQSEIIFNKGLVISQPLPLTLKSLHVLSSITLIVCLPCGLLS